MTMGSALTFRTVVLTTHARLVAAGMSTYRTLDIGHLTARRDAPIRRVVERPRPAVGSTSVAPHVRLSQRK